MGQGDSLEGLLPHSCILEGSFNLVNTMRYRGYKSNTTHLEKAQAARTKNLLESHLVERGAAAGLPGTQMGHLGAVGLKALSEPFGKESGAPVRDRA